MKTLFTDTSAFLSVLFKEPESTEVADLFRESTQVFASGLLEAEARSIAARKGLQIEAVDAAHSRLKWVLPERPLTQELRAAAACGIHLRGTDLWHVACALFLAGDPSALPFVTLDQNQALAAERLGFKVLPEPLTTGASFREPRGIYSSCPEQSRAGAVYRADKPKKKSGKNKPFKT